MVEIVDILATLTTIVGVIMNGAYFLQVHKLLKTRSSKDLSLPMFTIFAIGITLWLLYGLAINNLPLIIVNIVGVIGSWLVFGLIIRFRRS
jgi:MtN3 and saliva related transmembrane protein